MTAKETKEDVTETPDPKFAEANGGFSVVDRRISVQTDGEEAPSQEVELPTEIDPLQFVLLQGIHEATVQELEAKRLRVNELAKGVQDLEAQHRATLTRMGRDMERTISRSKGQLLDKLLHVLDGFQHSLDSIPVNEHTKPIMAGVQMIYRQFLTQLSELGLMQYAPLGETFDPARHEGLQKIAVTDPDKDGKVIQVIRAGYVHEGRVLRAAQVAVGNCEALAEEAPAPEQAETERTQTEG